MSPADILISFLPLILVLVFVVYMIRRTDAFGQKAHRQRIEELLERIAIAVEEKSKQ
jgi:preprotein translocase subunit YajC